MKKILKFFKWGVIVLICVIAVICILVKITVSGFGTQIVNSQLNARLLTESSVDKLSVALFKGKVGVRDFVVKETLTNETENMISIGDFSVDVGLGSLFSDVIEIENVTLKDAYVNVISPEINVYNLMQIAPIPTNETSEVTSDDDNAEMDDTQKNAIPPTIHIKEVIIENLNITYKDYNLSDPALFVGLTNITLKLENLTLFGEPDGKLHSNIELTLDMMQQNNTAYLGLWAQTGIIGSGTNIPAVNALLSIKGFDVRNFDQIIPANSTAAALGGSLIDLDVKASVADDYLNVAAVLASVTSKININVGGTPYKPSMDLSDILGSLGMHSILSVGSHVSNVGEAGSAIGGAAVDTGQAVVKGAGKTVGKLGAGLFNTLKSTVKGDLKEAGSHLAKTGKGTVGDVVSTVTNTTGTAASGISATGGELTNTEDSKTWRSNVTARKKKAWSNAAEELKAMPYPGK